MNTVDLMLVVLGAYGASFTFANLAGPFGVCTKLRKLIRKNCTQEWISHGIGCPICLCFWFAFPVTAIVLPYSTFPDMLQMSLATTGFASVVYMLSPPGGS